ncbi:MAG: PVC-type heme-binding CxxCH protein [Chthoniobacteraceae bacterium]
MRPLPLLLALALSATAAEFRFGAQTLTVPDGFIVERVAGPPLVDRPVEADFDEQGRLYVTEASGTNDKIEKQLADKPHRVLRLVDTDGDGTYDKRTVFADGLALPEGCLWHDGSLYVAAPPQIWKFTDSDDDGIAEKREVWFDGKTLTHCANDLHGPYLGPDGWFYWCKGAFADQSYTLADGTEFKTKASHIFRRRPEGGPVEPVLTGGMDNPVGLAFAATGERFLAGTFFVNPANGQRDGLIHAIYGGVYGKQTDRIEGHVRTSPALMPVMTHLGPAAACALMRAESDALGFRDQLFATSFNLRRVSRHELVPAGASFTTRDFDFLTSDAPDFHPTDVFEAPDGSVLIIDTGGWYKLCCPTSQLHKPDVLGAIYRVRRKDMPKAAAPRALAPGIAALSAIFDSEKDARTRVAAVWALTRDPSAAARDATRPALADRDPVVVQAALHSVSVWRDRGAAEAVTNLLGSGSLAIRRAAAEALGRIGNAASVPRLLRAESKGDRVLEHSLTYALIELAQPAATRAGGLSRRALVALDQMRGGDLRVEDVAPLLASGDATLRETAWWIAGRHPEWSTATLGALREALERKQLPAAEAETLLIGLAARDAAQQLITALATEPLGLRVIARSGLKTPPAAWFDAVAQAIDQGKPAALDAALALRERKPPSPVLAAALGRLAAKTEAPIETRLTALDAMPGPPADAFALLLRPLAPGQPLLLRRTAISVLRRIPMSEGQWLELVRTFSQCDPSARGEVLTLFERCGSETIGIALLAALPDWRGVSPDALRRAMTKFPAVIGKAATPIFASLGVDPAKQNARLDELAALLPTGDIRRGQAVFQSAKTACASCHAMGYLGGNVGPDLTRIGKIRTERDLIEALIFPSASFVRSYESSLVRMKAGELLGIVRADNANELTLVAGPGAEVRVPRGDVQSVEPAPTSLMPAGYDGVLTPQEIADLVVFLKASQ